jgi:hypothetical protein
MIQYSITLINSGYNEEGISKELRDIILNNFTKNEIKLLILLCEAKNNMRLMVGWIKLRTGIGGSIYCRTKNNLIYKGFLRYDTEDNTLIINYERLWALQ